MHLKAGGLNYLAAQFSENRWGLKALISRELFPSIINWDIILPVRGARAIPSTL